MPSDGKPVKAVAGAGFSPTDISPSLPVPEDFDEFWADQKRQLAEFRATPDSRQSIMQIT